MLTNVTAVILTLFITCALFLRLLFQAQTGYGIISSSDHDPKVNVDTHDAYSISPENHIFREPTHQKLRWRITSGMRRPDGVLKRVFLINDAFPGPTIEARSSDRITVEVENRLEDEPVSIHWHGLSMRGHNEMDGAAGITQQGIPPGGNFTYDFTIEDNQQGTFWYHAHDGIQRADGLYGGFVIYRIKPKDESDPMEVEKLLLISDWYHRSASEALHFYSHPGSFGNEPVPDSILLNGAGRFTCADAVPARPLDCRIKALEEIPAIKLDRSKRNVLRIVNVGSYAGIDFQIAGTTLLPIEVDGGHAIDEHPAQRVGFLEPGERIMVVVETSPNSQENHGLLTISLDDKPFKYPNSALSPVQDYPITWMNVSKPEVSSSQGVVEHFDLSRIKSTTDQSSYLPQGADKVIVLYSVTQKLSHLRNLPMGFINGTSWKPQTGGKALNALDRQHWDANQFVPSIPYNPTAPLWVDLIVNNLDEESHPFHLHGYDFWVLSTYSSTYNWGSYNPYDEEAPPGGAYDLQYAVKKDTVAVPRRGYAVLRVKFDNPGIWMFHCHVLWHQAGGMAMAFEVR